MNGDIRETQHRFLSETCARYSRALRDTKALAAPVKRGRNLARLFGMH